MEAWGIKEGKLKESWVALYLLQILEIELKPNLTWSSGDLEQYLSFLYKFT